MRGPGNIPASETNIFRRGTLIPVKEPFPEKRRARQKIEFPLAVRSSPMPLKPVPGSQKNRQTGSKPPRKVQLRRQTGELRIRHNHLGKKAAKPLKRRRQKDELQPTSLLKGYQNSKVSPSMPEKNHQKKRGAPKNVRVTTATTLPVPTRP